MITQFRPQSLSTHSSGAPTPKRFISLVVMAGSMLIIASCGGSGGGNNDSPSADLQGRWIDTECSVTDENESLRSEIVVDGNSVVQSAVFYFGNEICAGELTLNINLASTIVVSGEATALADGPAKYIDLNYTRAFVNTSEANMALIEASGTTLQDIYTAEGIEDIDNIPVSVYRDNDKSYSIYRVSGDSLRIGNSSGINDGSAPELRVNQLSTEVYIKQ